MLWQEAVIKHDQGLVISGFEPSDAERPLGEHASPPGRFFLWSVT